MNIQEMIQKSKAAAEKRRRTGTSLAFLQRANILDADGCYKEEFFSAETVAASRERHRQNTSPSS